MIIQITQVLTVSLTVFTSVTNTNSEKTSFQVQLEKDLIDTFFTDFAISISYYHKAIDLWVDYSVLLDNPVSIVDTKQGTVLINRTTKFQVNEYILKHAILKGDLIKLNGIEYIVAGYTSNGVGIISFWVNNAV